MKKTAKWIVTALAASLALLVMGCENEPDPVAVESITFIPDTLMLGVGDTVSLTVTVEPWDPLRTLTWESSDSAVVTVEYGEVTAVTVGKAIITLKAGGKQATCEVTVHVHFYSEGKCTVCGAEMKIEGYVIEDGGVLWNYYGDAAEVVIPEGITGIGNSAFYNKKNIKSVAIPGSVKSIGYSSDSLGFGAFEWCENLKTVTMDEGVESIGGQAFEYCMSLASVTIGKGVESIGDRVFTECTSLTDVKIPDSVKSVGDYAFYNCTSLASVTIPASVTEIGSDVFHSCYSLKTVNYGGTEEQWKAITKGYSYGLSGKTITGKDGSTWKATSY